MKQHKDHVQKLEKAVFSENDIESEEYLEARAMIFQYLCLVAYIS
jgi:hypothetical protein